MKLSHLYGKSWKMESTVQQELSFWGNTKKMSMVETEKNTSEEDAIGKLV